MRKIRCEPSLPLKTTRWSAIWRVGLLFAGASVVAAAAFANEPIVVLSANVLKFESQAQGTASSPQRVLVANTGTADLVISSISLSGENAADFLETHSCPTPPAAVPAGAHCEIQIIFKPRTSGDLSASVDISDNGSGSPRSVTLGGRSSVPVPLVTLSPAVLTFGNQAIGTSSKVQMILLTNAGSAILNINTAIALAGSASPEFHLQKVNGACPDGTGQLAPGASCAIGVIFAPVTAGPKSAQVVVVDDAANSPQAVAMSGVGSGN
jgi:HYDIN/CFA65/VesB family protein